jgi:hypothetical protein
MRYNLFTHSAWRRDFAGRRCNLALHSLLRISHVHHDAIERFVHDYLTAQAAVLATFGGCAIERLIFQRPRPRDQMQEPLIHIDMARGATQIAAAYSDDAIESDIHCRSHQARTGRYADFTLPAI